ncbi:MAG: hypothetical protein GVY33_01945 [Alphaproteobacteria bacterium]|jgi:surface antigen|nr:hypothetical protein [Alphaproteobacteria bacterium]
MAVRRRTCLAVLGAVAALPAAAQLNPFANRPRQFSTADRARMYRSMRTVLESGEVGETAAWTSADGSFGGVSELERTYRRDELRCGELRHRFVGAAGDAGVYQVKACDVPGEGWKFAF